MSELILKALIQLFALISDVHNNAGISNRGRDIVRLFLSRHLDNESVIRYMELFDEYLQVYHSENITRGSIKDKKRTSLTAMRILAICEKINEELHQKQKLYVLVQLIDFILFSAEISENEMDFLETVSTAFNIQQTEYKNIKNFILNSVNEIPEKNRVMIIDNEEKFVENFIKIVSPFNSDIPKYVYEIITMKIFRKTIDKSYNIYLDSYFMESEHKILETLTNQNLGMKFLNF